MNIENERHTLSEPKLIGALILGTERRPIRYASLPYILTITGFLNQKIQELWAKSSQDIFKREFAFLGTTEGDRKIHISKEPIIGDAGGVVVKLHRNSGKTKFVVVLHSHAIKDTPPSIPDIRDLLYGSDGIQGQIITTVSADFMLMRTDQTPIYLLDEQVSAFIVHHHAAVKEKLEKFDEHAIEEIREKFGSFSTTQYDAKELQILLKEQERQRNAIILQLMIDLCNNHFIGFYISRKDGVFTRVTNLGHVTHYIEGLTDSVNQEIDFLIHREVRSLHPESKRITSSDLSEELTARAKQQIVDLLVQFVDLHPKGFTELLEKFALTQNGTEEVSEKDLIASILEKGGHDLQYDTEITFAVTSGLYLLISQLGIIPDINAPET